MFNNQGNSKPEASQKENGDMASEWEELVELDDVQLATVVGGWGCGCWQPPIRGIRAFPAAYASLAGVDVTRIRHL